MSVHVLRADWLREEPFTLVLGAGFFGFFAHTGVLAALESAGLRPARVVGVSAGALAGGLWASGVPAGDLSRELRALRRSEFWDPGLPLGGLLKGERFGRILTRLIPQGVRRVEECPIPFGAGTHDIFGRRNLLLTEGNLEVAIRASCAVPFMFRPVRLGGRFLVDGGVSDREGLDRLEPDERVLHHHLIPHDGRGQAPGPGRRRLALVVEGLPRLGPFRLERGPEAYERARTAATSWLGEPVRELAQSAPSR